MQLLLILHCSCQWVLTRVLAGAAHQTARLHVAGRLTKQQNDMEGNISLGGAVWLGVKQT
jgi:hypothetical protein